MGRRTTNASIEVVSKDGPIDVNTMVREGLNALVKTFNDQNFWNESVLGQLGSREEEEEEEEEDDDDHPDTEENERFSITRNYRSTDHTEGKLNNKRAFLDTNTLKKAILELDENNNDIVMETNVSANRPVNRRPLIDNDCVISTDNGEAAQRDNIQYVSNVRDQDGEYEDQNLESTLDMIREGGITETELVIDYNNGNIGMEELNAAIYEKFTHLLNGSLDSKTFFDQWVQSQQKFLTSQDTSETIAKSKKKKTKKKKKKKKKTKNNEDDTDGTTVEVNITAVDDDFSVQAPEYHQASETTFSNFDSKEDLEHRNNGPRGNSTEQRRPNIETKTTYSRVDPLDELATLTEAKLRSLLPPEIFSPTASLAKKQGDNTERSPNFSYLAYIDEPLCYFCEYFLVFGELPVNTIKAYYKKMSTPSSSRTHKGCCSCHGIHRETGH